jgi:hypothetical protein
MSSQRENKNNEQNKDCPAIRFDRMYHDSESFLYRNRWWIVLILAVLLAYYLLTRKCDGTGSSASTSLFGPQVASPKIGEGELRLASPAVPQGTEIRKLFRL